MNYSPEQAAYVLTEINGALARAEPDELKVRRVWTILCVLRARLLASTMRNALGNRVNSGPFKGMQLIPSVLEGSFAPALLGIYESELHPIVERIVQQPYKHILNIGCAYGYYSVGFALRMPQTIIHAFDIEEKRQQQCREMAMLNGVQDRVRVGGEFRGEDFAKFANERTLVFMDIEGAEKALLDPALFPALQKMDVVVELHDLFDSTISETVLKRFIPTHEFQYVKNKPQLFDFESALGPLGYIDPADMFLAASENRDGPTPWGILWAKNP